MEHVFIRLFLPSTIHSSVFGCLPVLLTRPLQRYRRPLQRLRQLRHHLQPWHRQPDLPPKKDAGKKHHREKQNETRVRPPSKA